jgi:ATP-dependent Clp protease protease subunit
MTDRDWSQVLAQRLFEQRVVLLHGALDDMVANQVAAELMTLDAEGDGAVSLRIDSAEGSLAVALTVMDVIELLGVPVRALCMGRVGGPALGVVAVCSHRAAMPSTRFELREPPTRMDAPASQVAQWARVRHEERARYCARVAARVGQTADAVARDLDAGLFMGAEEAVTYGLIDEICRPDAEIRQLPGAPFGFRPR